MPCVDGDWRVRVAFDDEQLARRHAERIEEMKLTRDVRERLAGRIVVSQDGPTLFFYASTRDDAQAALQIAQGDVAADGWPAHVDLTRWHDAAEDWEPADAPLPRDSEERGAERERLMQREDEESAAQGYADWEVRIELPSWRDARSLADQLRDEGLPVVHRWRYLLVGAGDEDVARRLKDRLRREAPPESTLVVEGTFAEVERNNPFAFISALAGGI